MTFEGTFQEPDQTARVRGEGAYAGLEAEVVTAPLPLGSRSTWRRR